MANINRDYIITVQTNLDREFNKIPEVTIQNDLVFKKCDSCSATFYIILTPFFSDIELDLGVKKPSGEIFHITPQFVGISPNSEYLYEISLKDEQKDEIGKYVMELAFLSDETRTTIFQESYRVKDCL